MNKGARWSPDLWPDANLPEIAAGDNDVHQWIDDYTGSAMLMRAEPSRDDEDDGRYQLYWIRPGERHAVDTSALLLPHGGEYNLLTRYEVRAACELVVDQRLHVPYPR
ncbi:hypothetical protein [Luteipulveratus halotolerans]|uniref:Uncharacterized protein n=1 Tax=Luteipulveratus halotolerans TaxID=1631356 RepID=A0A0L6CEA7_9MICO|nr:hypothetical protein [Luteipulveratus halotolerans]KNX35920.1 hypothetical protein VV01_21945 [Luteipulveratus halotolerans]